MTEQGAIKAVPESRVAPNRPQNTMTTGVEGEEDKKERKGKFKLQEGTVSRLLNTVFTVVEKVVPDLKGKMVLSDLEAELVDEMATGPIEKFLRQAGIEADTVEILAVLVIICAPRVFAVIDVVQHKKKEKVEGLKTKPEKSQLHEVPKLGEIPIGASQK